MRVFLDNAATTPLDKEVIQAMIEVMNNVPGNPSSIHKEGREARTVIEKSRKTIASLLGVTPGEIFFTSGGTEADNMAIKGLVMDKKVDCIISSKIEHHAVTHTVDKCKEVFGTEVKWVKLLPNGHIDLSDLANCLQNSPKGRTLVSLMHANNEIGNLLDMEQVGALCKEHNAYFHSDTVQTLGHLPLKLKEWNVAFSIASAHKFNGPKGVGFIFINSDLVKIKPFIDGGAQERNMRGGTENIYSFVGMAKALEIAYQEMDEHTQSISTLKQYMAEQLKAEIPNVVFNGDCMGKSSYTVLSVGIPPFEGSDMLLFNMDIKGVAVSGGSACSSGSSVGSHVIAEIDFPDGYSVIRFSFGKQNTKEDIDFAVAQLKSIIQPVAV